MAIRIRRVGGKTVALCAAKTKKKIDDIYLDDNIHHALSTKFGLDWMKMGFIDNPPIDEELRILMECEEEKDSHTS